MTVWWATPGMSKCNTFKSNTLLQLNNKMLRFRGVGHLNLHYVFCLRRLVCGIYVLCNVFAWTLNGFIDVVNRWFRPWASFAILMQCRNCYCGCLGSFLMILWFILGLALLILIVTSKIINTKNKITYKNNVLKIQITYKKMIQNSSHSRLTQTHAGAQNGRRAFFTKSCCTHSQ